MITRAGAQLQMEVHPNGRRGVPMVVTFAGGGTPLTDELNLASLTERESFLASFPDDTKDEARRLLGELAVEVARMPKPAADEEERQGQAVAFADPEAAAEAVDGVELLERVRAFINRFLGLPPSADVLLAAFAVYT